MNTLKRKKKIPTINWGFKCALYKLQILPHLNLRIENYYFIPNNHEGPETQLHSLEVTTMVPTQRPFLTSVLTTRFRFVSLHISRRERRKIQCDWSKLCFLWMALVVRLYLRGGLWCPLTWLDHTIILHSAPLDFKEHLILCSRCPPSPTPHLCLCACV